jgi:hypothetical protein
MKRWNEVEPAIITGLYNPDLNRARQAAETLSKYGGAKAQKALWERLRNLHAQWASREKDLNGHPGQPHDASEAMGFQFGLVDALGRAQGWLLTNEQVMELENLTLGSEKENVKHWRWTSPVDLSVNLFPDERLQVDINHQYLTADLPSLRNKLAQYPSGTRFWLTVFAPQEQLAPALLAITDVAAEHGLFVESAPQQ